VVALVDEQVAGFAYLQSDGHIQAHLSLIAVAAAHRRRGMPALFSSTSYR
jgi:ribosomal protein S18 acetylase RimI-like enzyme